MQWICLCSLAVTLVACSLAADGSENQQRTIHVTGQGQATAPPDMATIQSGVVTQANQASEAVAANNRVVDKILELLKAYNIASKDIQTSRFHVQPEYDRPQRGKQPPRIVGYRVTNQVSVRIRNLPELGTVLDALVSAGSNQISGISFGIDDPTGVLNQARNRAVADARSRANLYAHAAGVQLGPVISIREQSAQVPRQEYFGRAMMADSARAVPVATGEQEVEASVSMVFAILDQPATDSRR